MFAKQQQLKQAIRNGEPRLGLFVKTPAPQIIEAVAHADLDFIVLDGEHGPFGAQELDLCILAARASAVPILVRVREPSNAGVLEVLDMGAAGVIAPHIASAEVAQRFVAACRYQGGGRGFSGLSRPSRYGQLPADQYQRASDEATIIIAQIEDAAGVDHVAEIAAVEELDALFVGRADLAVSLGADSITHPDVAAAVGKILTAGQQSGKATGIFLPTPAETAQFHELGASLFAIGTDQSLLIDTVAATARAFRTATGSARD